MALEQYKVTTSEHAMIFDFTSIGKHGEIRKCVHYSETNIPNIYNLGFGDVHPIHGNIDDLAISNNGDSQKVLATVAATALTFAEYYPDGWVYIVGAMPARTRLYRIGIANNLDFIAEHFLVLGLRNGEWLLFEPNQEYEAFLARRKKNL
jgi:hypothetical protein